LARQVGRSTPDSIELNGTYPPLLVLPPLAQLLDRAEQVHPKVGIQQTLVDISKADMLINISKQRPTLSLGSNYIYANDFSLPGSNYFQVLLKLAVPLYDFGNYRAEIIASEINLQAEETRLEIVRKTIRNEIAHAYAEIREIESRIVLIEKEVLKNEIKLKTVQAQREQGLIGPLDVLEAESPLIDLQQSLADARKEQQLKYAALKRIAIGV